MNKIRLYISYLLFLLSVCPAYSQFDRLQNYNVKDGLPSSEVYGVIQDSKGYIWTIGDMGASRFDGYEFKSFNTGNGLPDNSIIGIYEDKKGRIWFRSISGKLSFYLDDSIYVLPCNDAIKQMLQRRMSTSIHVDDGDTVWLGTTGNYLLKIGPGWKDNSLQQIKIPDGYYLFTIDNKGFVHGGTPTQGLVLTAYNSGIDILFSIDAGRANEKLTSSRSHITRSRDGTYIASLQETMIRFNKDGIIHMAKESSTIICFQEEMDGSIITGTYTGVATRGRDLAVRNRLSQLNNKVITGICIDRENGLWFSTEGHGIYCIPHRNFKYYTPENGLSPNKITHMAAHEGMLMTGHLNGPVSLLDKDTVLHIPLSNENGTILSTLEISSFFKMDGKLYASTYSGIHRFEHNIFQYVPGLKAKGIAKIIGSRDGNIWAVFFSHLIKYDPRQSYKEIKKVKLETRTDNLFEDSKGDIWLCGMDGVYTYNEKGLVYLGATNKLFSHRPVKIGEARDNSICIATRGGGLIIKKGDVVRQITEADGLAGSMCRSLLVEHGTIWVGTNKGLSKVTTGANGEYKIENFYSENGLLTNEVNSIIRHENKLLLAHNNGVTIFDPANVKSNTSPPLIYISKIRVNNKIHSTKKLQRLEHDQNYLAIDYTGLSFKDAGKVEYKYKMTGMDSSWIHSRYTSVIYHAVPPGTYTFVVYAKNNDGYWSSKPATISFTVLPAWWQTWVFRVAAGLALLLLILLIFRSRLKRLRKREQEKAMLQFRLAEAELKALRSQMNPHFIYNTLNSVQYFITSNDPVSSQKYLSKFAKLIRYVVDNSKPASILLRTEIEALTLYCELESLRFENGFEYEINIHDSVDMNYTRIPSMLIQPYVENAIWHGIMHKKEKGKIEVLLEMQGDMLRCIVRDNGIGRRRSNEIKQARGEEAHRSIGMSNTKERLDIINQVNDTKLHVIVTDLTNAQGEAAGTQVELNILSF